MKTYLINLDVDHDRLDAAKKQLHKLDIPFERIPGFDGNGASESFFHQFVSLRPREKGRVWRRGQMGCFLSHYNVWDKFVKSGEPYGLILEDDNHLSSNLSKFTSDKSWIPEDADIVRLEIPTKGVKVVNIGAVHGRDLYKLKNTSWCAAAYIISRKCAQTLLALPPATHMPTDRMLFCFEDSAVARSLNIYQISPALSIQDKFAHEEAKNIRFKSNIESANSTESLKSRGFISILKICAKAILGYRDIVFKD